MDNPNFAGGEFSYWQRQQLRLFGVNLMQQRSLVPDLRSSKIQGQANFVNPGLFLVNVGFDLDVTPRWRLINNANVLWFDSVTPLQQFTYQQHVNRFIGVDLSTGMEYRPLLNNNVIFKAGFATLIPGQGFRDLFNNYDHNAQSAIRRFLGSNTDVLSAPRRDIVNTDFSTCNKVRPQILVGLTILAAILLGVQPWSLGQEPRAHVVDLRLQTKVEADVKSAGCIQCHQNTGDPHDKGTVNLGCIDCHGGDGSTNIKERAHIQPRFPDAWRNSGNPVRSYTLLNHETPEFIRFVNPGDLRIAHIACGNCHQDEVQQSRTSMMTHGCMLWGAALYNNGSVPHKQSRYGESYSMNGVPQRLQTWPPPSRI